MDLEVQWNLEKNEELRARFGFGFERAVIAITDGMLLAERAHPNEAKYAHQRQFVIEIDGYVWVVPFVRDGSVVFLKTMFPSRTATREFFGDRHA